MVKEQILQSVEFLFMSGNADDIKIFIELLQKIFSADCPTAVLVLSRIKAKYETEILVGEVTLECLDFLNNGE